MFAQSVSGAIYFPVTVFDDVCHAAHILHSKVDRFICSQSHHFILQEIRNVSWLEIFLL